MWGYGHIIVFGALVATGAGLDVAATATESDTPLPAWAVASAVTVPVIVLLLVFVALYSLLMGTLEPFHLLLVAGALVMLASALLAAGAGAPLGLWLSLVVAAPVVVIVGYETVGHRHQAARLDEVLRN